MKILIAYDGSDSANAAIEDLLRAGLPQQSEAFVICVADENFHGPEAADRHDVEHRFWKSRLAEAEALAEKAGSQIRCRFPEWTVSCEALWGAPAKVILAASARWHPDLLVVGSHGRSRIARLFLGSVSLELVHKAAGAVRVSRASGSAAGPVRIVIGNDGSKEADAVIRSVAARSWPEKTEAVIVCAVQTIAPAATALDASTFAQEPAYSVIREADERMRFRLKSVAAESVNALGRSGLIAVSTVADGDPREMILAEAERLKADAIFIGARGLGRLERLMLGSVSSHVLTHAHCTVEVVRG